jgi:8-oxo-dGTP diphosphatase
MPEVRALAADAVVVIDGEALFMERDHEPYEGAWVLPGGLVEPDETAREACVRETREEVGLDVEATAFVGLYDGPGRDPRDNVSAAYRCEPADGSADPEPREEARRVETFPPGGLPETGFDHADVVADAF